MYTLLVAILISLPRHRSYMYFLYQLDLILPPHGFQFMSPLIWGGGNVTPTF